MEGKEKLIRKILQEELDSFMEKFFVKIRLETIPFLSGKEQKNIETLYGKDLLEDDDKDIKYSKKVKL